MQGVGDAVSQVVHLVFWDWRVVVGEITKNPRTFQVRRLVDVTGYHVNVKVGKPFSFTKLGAIGFLATGNGFKTLRETQPKFGEIDTRRFAELRKRFNVDERHHDKPAR